MPKPERGTPKDLANRMKAKGLQKLRWYCQMCQKQCRDENGFKCHTMSEGHQRQLLLFADNPNKFLDEYSKEFKDGYVELLRRRFGTKRVHANQIYQEYISNKDHLHMNATKWLTLTEFVKWLGREGICSVDETEKGWFVTYIDRDPETIARQQQLAKKEKMDKDDEERMLEFIEKQVERAATLGNTDGPQYTELVRTSEEEKLQLQLNLKASSTKPFTSTSGTNNVFKTIKKDWDTASVKSYKSTTSSSSDGKRKLSALEQIKEEQERMKQKKFRKDFWLTNGIVVKVVTKRLGDKYYKEKGVIVDVIDKYVGIIKMLETGHKLKLDQEHLETVIPSPGREVRILNGEYRGYSAILQSVDMDKFSVTLRINSGEFEGTTLRGIAYEDISKLHVT
ncbi:unnamed protein product [Orchesella dallaii]|uniref:DNA/RNA-binding protein Kin17 WH-like domain-containing protein n=1 Tax=Orchesella dallaii TaxID=48710 RepID=A0ABP1QFD8_9HEXA